MKAEIKSLLVRSHTAIATMLTDIHIDKSDPDYRREWKLLRDLEKELKLRPKKEKA